MNTVNNTTQKISTFYDDFADKQIKTGVNLRHFVLFEQIVKLGLKKNNTVLEIGCGVGTLTGLLHKYVSKGKIVATDISGKSIEAAKKRIKDSLKIDFLVTDMQEFTSQYKFDFIILADVLEHIPVDYHHKLFKTLQQYLANNGKIAINIPSPFSIEYYQKHHPELLQVVDQALRADRLIKDASENGLVLETYNLYSLFHKECDYVWVVFKNINASAVEFITAPKIKIIIKKLQKRVFYILTILNSRVKN